MILKKQFYSGKSVQDLEFLLEEVNKIQGVSTPIFCLIHPPHGQVQQQDWREWLEINQNGGGVLFFSGEPAQAKNKLAIRLEDEPWPDRWYFLHEPILNEVFPELYQRFEDFLIAVRQLESHDPIPWDLLMPKVFEPNLLAVYFWCLAVSDTVLDSELPEELVDAAESTYLEFAQKLNEEESIPSLQWAGIRFGDQEACKQAKLEICKQLKEQSRHSLADKR